MKGALKIDLKIFRIAFIALIIIGCKKTYKIPEIHQYYQVNNNEFDSTVCELCNKVEKQNKVKGTIEGPCIFAVKYAQRDSNWNLNNLIPVYHDVKPNKAKTLFCIKGFVETVGRYTDLSKAQVVNWEVFVLKLPEGKLMTRFTLHGSDPADEKIGMGSRAGKEPIDKLYNWFRQYQDINGTLYSPSSDIAAFSSKNTQIAVIDYNFLKIHDYLTGAIIKETRLPNDFHGTHVSCLKFSPNENYIAIGWNFGKISIWNLNNNKITTKDISNASVNFIEFFSDGKFFAAINGDNGSIAIYDIETLSTTLIGKQENEVLDAFLSDDEKYIYCACTLSSKIQILNATDLKQIDEIPFSVSPIRRICPSPENNNLVIMSQSGIAEVIDMKTKKSIYLLKRLTGIEPDITFISESIFALYDHFGIRIWNLDNKQFTKTISGKCLAINSENMKIAIHGSDFVKIKPLTE